MNRINAFLFAATIVAVPLASAEAQDKVDSIRRRPGKMVTIDRRVGPDFAGRIIAMKSDLKLTDDQVAKLTVIQKKYVDINSVEREKVRSERTKADSGNAMTEEQRREMRQKMEGTRKEFMKNHEASRKEVLDVLTDEQESQLKQLKRERTVRKRHPRNDG